MKKQKRYRLIDNRTGRTVAAANTLAALRLEIATAQAAAFTIYDRRLVIFMNAELIFRKTVL